ncbi:WD40 repeat domain-containing protein [Micromonospora sp. LAH09]|uniref:WD40 repeat domain-containing protein n=1 Tax=Micromonospora cabrerizensis TaxID=2911213 RepID=UPI001EE98E30|nr:WD40 repeat domain-containing protein [Micromonospora cabrerizensis]MCG5469186.1 WD40 repeat domain-containing protein [Micromonospora cabrerizensis]
MAATTGPSRPEGSMWPFLVSPAGRGGNRPIVLPDLDLGSDHGRLLQALVRTDDGIVDGLVETRELETRQYGHLTLVFRRVRAGSDGAAHVWDLAERRRIAGLTGHVARITDVAFSPDGRLVATASWDHTVRVWDVRSAQTVATLDGHDSWVVGCRFTRDGRTVVTATADGTIAAYDVTSGARTVVARLEVVLVGPMEINRTGRVLLVAAADHTVRAIQLRRGEQVGVLRGHRDRITACALAPNGLLLATASRDRTVRVWDLATGVERDTLTGHQDWVTGLAWPAEGWIASVGWDGTLRRWSPRQEVLLREVGPLRACVAVPGGQQASRLVVTGEHGRIVRWDAAHPDATAILAGDAGWIDVARCSPDGQLMVTGSHNDGPAGAHPFRDGFGRPATMVEGVLLAGRRGDAVLTDLDWQRVHAVCLDGLGTALTDHRGDLVVRSGPQNRPGDPQPAVTGPTALTGRRKKRSISAGEPALETRLRRGGGCALSSVAVALLALGGLWEVLTRLLG